MIFRINLFIIILLFIPVLIYLIANRNKSSIYKTIFILIFFVYFVNLLKYAVFPIYIGSDISNVFKSEYNLIDIIKMNTNIVPFISGLSLKDFILNIIMTFPLGFLLPTLAKNLNIKKIFGIGAVVGLGIELIQFLMIFIQGFTFRNININDSIANFLGVVLGYLVFIMVLKLFNDLFENSKNKFFKNLLVYLLEINK